MIYVKKNKVDSLKPAGLLHPLPIPDSVWSDIFMDFVEGLPPSNGKTVIFVIVDRLNKNSHFLAKKHPFMVNVVAKIFDNLFKLQVLLRTIVSDRDMVFLSSF